MGTFLDGVREGDTLVSTMDGAEAKVLKMTDDGHRGFMQEIVKGAPREYWSTLRPDYWTKKGA